METVDWINVLLCGGIGFLFVAGVAVTTATILGSWRDRSG